MSIIGKYTHQFTLALGGLFFVSAAHGLGDPATDAARLAEDPRGIAPKVWRMEHRGQSVQQQKQHLYKLSVAKAGGLDAAARIDTARAIYVQVSDPLNWYQQDANNVIKQELAIEREQLAQVKRAQIKTKTDRYRGKSVSVLRKELKWTRSKENKNAIDLKINDLIARFESAENGAAIKDFDIMNSIEKLTAVEAAEPFLPVKREAEDKITDPQKYHTHKSGQSQKKTDEKSAGASESLTEIDTSQIVGPVSWWNTLRRLGRSSSADSIKNPAATENYTIKSYQGEKITRLEFMPQTNKSKNSKRKAPYAALTPACLKAIQDEFSAPKGVHLVEWKVGMYNTAEVESGRSPDIPCQMPGATPVGAYQFTRGTANKLKSQVGKPFPHGRAMRTLEGMRTQTAYFKEYFKNNLNDIIENDDMRVRHHKDPLIGRQFVIQNGKTLIVSTATAARLSFASHAGLGIIKGGYYKKNVKYKDHKGRIKTKKIKTFAPGLEQWIINNPRKDEPVRISKNYMEQDFSPRFIFTPGNPKDRAQDEMTAARLREKYKGKYNVVLADYWDNLKPENERILKLSMKPEQKMQVEAILAKTSTQPEKIMHEARPWPAPARTMISKTDATTTSPSDIVITSVRSLSGHNPSQKSLTREFAESRQIMAERVPVSRTEQSGDWLPPALRSAVRQQPSR